MGIMDMFSGAIGSAGSITPGAGENQLNLGLPTSYGGDIAPLQAVSPETGGTSNQGTGLLGMAAKANQPGTIMGMSPDSFSTVMGGMGAAISKKGSWQEKLGSLARGIGAGQLGMMANKVASEADQAKMLEVLKADPNFAKTLSAAIGQPSGIPLNPGSVSDVAGVTK